MNQKQFNTKHHHLGASPVAAAGTPSIAVAIARIEAEQPFPLQRRRTTVSALRLLARLCGGTEGTVILDPAVVGPVIKSATPASAGISRASLAAYRVAISSAMRWLGLIDPPNRSHALLGSAWAALRDALPDKFLSMRLQSFMAYCDAAGVPPAEVSTATLLAYGTAIKQRRLTKDPADNQLGVAKAWNRAARSIAGWPLAELRLPPRKNRISASFSTFTVEFQAELAAFRKAVVADAEGNANTSLYETIGQPTLRATSLATYERGLRLAAAALVETGMPIERIESVDVLIHPDHIKRILDYHWHRAGKCRTHHTGGIAAALGALARHRLGADSPAYADLRPLLRAAKPEKPRRMTVTNERRLAQFDDPIKLACLLHLPEALFTEATALKDAGRLREAGWTAQVAIAVAIELRCPMRALTLASLRPGHTLLRLNGRKPAWGHYEIPPEGKKAGRESFRWPVARETSAFIERYLTAFRPLLGPGAAASPFLFPSRDKTDAPRSEIALAAAVSTAIWRLVGVDMNIHLFRALAGKLILDDNPGALEDLRLLLDHTTCDTALRYYRSHQPAKSAERVDAAIDKKMRETKPLAKLAFAKQKRGVPRGRGDVGEAGR